MAGYITFEGIDGCGKSTQIDLLHKKLIENKFKSVCIREPGSTAIGNEIRKLLLKKENRNISAFSEVCLFLLNRSETYQEITKKKIKEGYFVISDRGPDSSLSYQDIVYSEFISLGNKFSLENRQPDLTFLLDIDVWEAKKRLKDKHDYYDYIDSEEKETIRRRYLEMAKREPSRIFILDANKDINDISDEIMKIVRKRLL